MADVWVWAFVAITFVRFWLTQQRFIIMKRYVLILGLTFLFRSFTIVATLLPQPQKSCVATAVGNPFLDGLLIMLLQKKTCTDMFYSGHTVNLSMAAMLWTMFSHNHPIVPLTAVDRTIFCGTPVMDRFGHLLRPTITKIVAWVCVVIGCFFISATRLHYLIDVCMGMFVSVSLFLVCCLLLLQHHNPRSSHFTLSLSAHTAVPQRAGSSAARHVAALALLALVRVGLARAGAAEVPAGPVQGAVRPRAGCCGRGGQD